MGRTRIAASRTFWLVAVLTVALGHVPAIAADTGAVTLGMEPVVPQEFSPSCHRGPTQWVTAHFKGDRT